MSPLYLIRDLLQCQSPESVVSIMRSLYIDLNEMVTQDVCKLIDGVQVSDYNPLLKYNNTKSNVPVVRPVVSTTSDPLSEDDSDNTDNDENEVSCPLHRGSYKIINYSSNDEHARKNTSCHHCISHQCINTTTNYPWLYSITIYIYNFNNYSQQYYLNNYHIAIPYHVVFLFKKINVTAVILLI